MTAAARKKRQRALLSAQRVSFQKMLLSSLLSSDDSGVPNVADKGSKASIAISQSMLEAMGDVQVRAKGAGQTSGHQFESIVANFIKQTFFKLQHLRPGTWRVLPDQGKSGIDLTTYEQYAHLGHLNAMLKQYPELQAALGSDYLIKPDVVVLREAESDSMINAPCLVVDDQSCRLSPLRKLNRHPPASGPWFLHASISCKWTLRSDRAQNARSEALNLIRNRKGRVPHIAAVTAEPLPMRLASLAMGSSDLDCVYHVSLPELEQAVASYASKGHSEQQEALDVLIEGRRLRDISDLPLDLVI